MEACLFGQYQALPASSRSVNTTASYQSDENVKCGAAYHHGSMDESHFLLGKRALRCLSMHLWITWQLYHVMVIVITIQVLARHLELPRCVCVVRGQCAMLKDIVVCGTIVVTLVDYHIEG